MVARSDASHVMRCLITEDSPRRTSRRGDWHHLALKAMVLPSDGAEQSENAWLLALLDENPYSLSRVPSCELCYNLDSHAFETRIPDELSELYPP
jgi:hypothetical protein